METLFDIRDAVLELSQYRQNKKILKVSDFIYVTRRNHQMSKRFTINIQITKGE